jgi:hypothetical protein
MQNKYKRQTFARILVWCSCEFSEEKNSINDNKSDCQGHLQHEFTERISQHVRHVQKHECIDENHKNNGEGNDLERNEN